MDIVVLDGGIANPGDLSWAEFEKFGNLTVYEDSNRHNAAARIGAAQVVILNKVPITRETMQACPGLKYIGLLSTGYNIIDIQAAKELGIIVCNVPGYSTDAVAQHTIALLLEICNQVGHHSAEVFDGQWSETEGWSFWNTPLIELSGKTLGVIGFGSIGQATGKIAKALGMQVLATGSRPTPQGQALAQYVPLQQLLAQSDVVALHCPLLPQTENIINKENINKMKQGAILLNTARGGLVQEQDLADALNSGRLTAAGLDVVSREPIRSDNPLLHAKNCFITPHIAWAAYETRARLLALVQDNLQAFLQGKPTNVVNL
ncbi:D-2-hydroxyacid dehydrogenase [Ruminococcaceae bacterium OttesenSCG-928-A16]|nr:D-2-hydroxyacid dehydrogenase [Ruminococcaceae bacterium OttesenSCG-928-A16]